MSINSRREKEKNERRNLILNTANEIIKAEGIENLSIRKIAKIIDYSPTMVYHYFESKDDIVNQLMKRGYQKIINSISFIEDTEDTKEKFINITKNYIYSALDNADEYMSIMLSNSKEILNYTAVLFKDAKEDRRAINMLCQLLEEIDNNQIDDVELTAQILWTSLFGLIIKIIIEDVDKTQREALINHYLKLAQKAIF